AVPVRGAVPVRAAVPVRNVVRLMIMGLGEEISQLSHDHERSRRGGGRGGVGWRVLIACTLVALVVSGCAAIPSAGPVQSTPPAQGGVGSGCCRLIVKPPQRDWAPEQVVSGFLLASAQFAHGHAIARKYLTPEASRSWRPLSAVTILAEAPKVYRQRARLTGPGGRTMVVVTGHVVATLRSGQYIPSPQGDAVATTRAFALELVSGRYLISELPGVGAGKVSHELLLTSNLFHVVYTPRDLYYPLPNGTLVPNPVFVPTEGPNPTWALVNDLRHDPSGWLHGAASTAFPPKATIRKVQILPGSPGGKLATVDIGLPRDDPWPNLNAMAAQLVVTLTSPAYGQPLFQAVKLKLNGQPWPDLPGGQVQRLTNYAQYIPRPRGNAVYYLTLGGAVRVLSRLAARGEAVRGEAGTGDLPLSKIAVSPDGRYLAGTAGPATTVYTCNLVSTERSRGRVGKLHSRLTGSSFSALSWDRAGNLWIAGRVKHSPGVWVLLSGKGPATRVHLPNIKGPVTGLRVAPDGVRVALIAGRGASSHLLLGAIVRTGTRFSIPQTVPLGPGLTHVSALTWFDTDHLMAITNSNSVTRLWDVPADGDGAERLATPAGLESVTAAGPQYPLYVGLRTGRLEKSIGVNEPWTDVTDGRAATYPG
ncbi:MAG TPA: LpqB family beta-propeller domain-containing protein, partial [Streptosporangiaceae bacterium]